MENILLLNNNVSGTCEETTIKKKIISTIRRNKKLLTCCCALSSLVQYAHISYRSCYLLSIRVEDSRLQLFSISFSFLFWDLELGVSVTSHVTVTVAESYDIMKDIEEPKTNNVI